MIDRFSIRVILAMIAGFGVALAAIRSPSGPWVLFMFLANLFLVLTATLGVLITRNRERVGWIGIAVFGWGYYFVSGQVPFLDASSDLDAGIAPIFLRLHPETPRPPRPLAASGLPAQQAYQDWNVLDERLSEERGRLRGQFVGILHALIGIGVALAGGIAASGFKRRHEQPD